MAEAGDGVVGPPPDFGRSENVDGSCSMYRIFLNNNKNTIFC